MIRNKSFENKTPFYLIATPIGNLSEVSPRFIQTVKELDFITCEDTRVTGKLLAILGLNKPLFSVHEFNEASKADFIITKLKEGQKGGYMSDAGYPLISDPGAILVDAIITGGFSISVINGPSALLPALIGSAISSSQFYFHGFIEPKISEQDVLALSRRNETIILYEAPHRIQKTLKMLYPFFNNRKATLVREISKLHEEYIYSTIEELLTLDFSTIIGELVLVIEGIALESIDNSKEISLKVDGLVKEGYKLKEAIRIVSHFYKFNKNELYNKYLKDIVK